MANIFTVTQIVYNFTATSVDNSFTVNNDNTLVTITNYSNNVTIQNTTTNIEIITDGIISTYQPSSAIVDKFSGNAVKTAFTLTQAPLGMNFIEVDVGGVTQIPGDSWTLTNQTIVFTEAPTTGTNNIVAQYYTLLTGVSIVGPTGPQGPSGPSGPQGVSGISGISGYSGISGFSGYSGISGFSGPAGGPSGPSGPQGLSGFSGFSGYSGVGVTRIAQTVNTNTDVTLGNLKVRLIPVSSTITTSTGITHAPQFSVTTGTYTVIASDIGTSGSNTTTNLTLTPQFIPLGHPTTAPNTPLGGLFLTTSTSDLRAGYDEIMMRTTDNQFVWTIGYLFSRIDNQVTFIIERLI